MRSDDDKRRSISKASWLLNPSRHKNIFRRKGEKQDEQMVQEVRHWNNSGHARICFGCLAAADGFKPDPSGSSTGGIADIVGASPGAPTADEIQGDGSIRTAGGQGGGCGGEKPFRSTWSGPRMRAWSCSCRRASPWPRPASRLKNAGHTMAMNFMVYVIGMLGYWGSGFALQMGGAGPCHPGRRRGDGFGVHDFLVRQGIRLVRYQGVLSFRGRITTSSSSPCFSSRWSSWTPPLPFPQGLWPGC